MPTSDDASLRRRLVLAVVLYAFVLAGTAVLLGALYLYGVPLVLAYVERAYDVHFYAGFSLVLGTVFTVIIVGSHLFVEVRESPIDRVGADPIYERAYGDVLERLDAMASEAGVPTPEVYTIDSEVPASFAAGVFPSRSRIVLTRELLNHYDDEVIDAVLAHELAHIDNRDGAVMYIFHVFPAITYSIANAVYRPILGDGGAETKNDSTATPRQAARGTAGRAAEMGNIYEGETGGTRPRFRNAGNFNALRFVEPRALPAALALLVVAILTLLLTGLIALVAWFASAGIYRLLSHVREYAADDRAAAILGSPEQVARMLEALEAGMEQATDEELLALDGGHEPLYVLGIDRGLFDRDPGRLLGDDLFPASHPPTADRIERLRY